MDLMEKVAAAIGQGDYNKIRRNYDHSSVLTKRWRARDTQHKLAVRRNTTMSDRITKDTPRAESNLRKAKANYAVNKYLAAKKSVAHNAKFPHVSSNFIEEDAYDAIAKVNTEKLAKARHQSNLMKRYTRMVDHKAGKLARRGGIAGMGLLAAGAIGAKVHDSMQKKAAKEDRAATVYRNMKGGAKVGATTGAILNGAVGAKLMGAKGAVLGALSGAASGGIGGAQLGALAGLVRKRKELSKKASDKPSHVGHDGTVFYSGVDHKGSKADSKTSVKVKSKEEHVKGLKHHYKMVSKDPDNAEFHNGRALAHYWAAGHSDDSYDN